MNRLRLFASLLLLTFAAHGETLTTKSFIVEIRVNCAEGDVVCDDVSYVGKSRQSGKSVSLRGRTLHSKCADGVTPCRFLGYEFKSGQVIYRVLESGELIVTQGKKTLVQEKGEWQP